MPLISHLNLFLFHNFPVQQLASHYAKMEVNQDITLDEFPDEVLLKIYNQMDFKSVASLRQTNKHFAEVGAEALTKRVRFHCTKQSLERLHAISKHSILCKYVETIVFEGNLLAWVPCIHTYMSHYTQDHHANERPLPPLSEASPREKRLYTRNMAKFQREVQKKYDRYKALYNEQQEVINSNASTDLIDLSMLRFPRLTKVALSTVGRCKHVLSGRFLDSFAADCAMPIEQDTKYTKDQMKHLLFPNDQPLTCLRTLEAHVISPHFFTGFVPKDMILQVFQNLKVIDLNFRLEKEDRINLDVSTADRCYADLNQGILRDALSAATDLEQLTINFDDYGYYGWVTKVSNILGDASWPKLVSLNLDCMATSEDYLLEILKRQPALRDVRLGFMTLDKGTWQSATGRMRHELDLDHFLATGILEDSDQMYPMHVLDGDAYASDFVHITLGEALGLWITDVNAGRANVPFDADYHPLRDEEFTDEEDLREQYGPFADDDEFSDMDCDSD